MTSTQPIAEVVTTSDDARNGPSLPSPCASGTSSVHDVPAQLMARRRVWQRKRSLRAVYQHWAQLMRPWLPDGPLLEVGTGSGTLSAWVGSVFQSDIQVAPGLDLAADVHSLPLQSGCLGGCLGVDVIHHLADPHSFFDELTRVLRPGGRGIFIEPYISPLSHLAYGVLHHESICFDQYQENLASDDPWQGNLAMANILFTHERTVWPTRHPNLRVIHLRPFDLFQVLACGYKKYSLAPWPELLAVLMRSEWLVPRPLLSRIAFRTLVVLQRSADL